jgi:hypothetical protein
VNRKLTWTPYIDTNGVGFFLSWARESEPAPRVYDNTRRIDLKKPAGSEIVVIDAKNDASASLCFRMTAYDAAKRESQFSNESCGWFGLSVVQNLKAVE